MSVARERGDTSPRARPGRRPRPGVIRRGVLSVALVLGGQATGCESAPPRMAPLSAQETIEAAAFTSLVERISEAGGYFDTDNLISNETGYLNVMDALAALDLRGGAYIGVGPDQNFSYIAELRPSVAFIVDVRRDNLLHHLLLKALVELSPTRVEFLSRLHGVTPPQDATSWRSAPVEEVVAYVDSAWSADGRGGGAGGAGAPGGSDVRSGEGSEWTALTERVRGRVEAYDMGLSADDFETIARFHRTFANAGPSLRFTSFGRAPRPYYPTYRQLVLETDADGDRVSYLADAERYEIVRELHLANRIVPVVGDLAGSHAVREIGTVLAEMGLKLDAFYVSNVEYYLWQSRSFGEWVENVRALPVSEDAVVIRSYFPNFGGPHPSAIRGYYATQSLQPLASLAPGDFRSYWDVVTRDALPLR